MGGKEITAFAYKIRKISSLREILLGFQERFYSMDLVTYLLSLLRLGG
jgi:hypothetical protein